MNIIESYLNSKINKETRIQYRRHVELFAAGKKVEELSIDDVSNYLNWLKDTGKKPATVAYARIIIRDFLRFADREDVAKKVKSFKYQIDSWKPISLEEFTKLDTHVDDSVFWGLQFRLMCRLLWESGMRCNEICTLKIGQVDIRNGRGSIISEKAFKERFIFWSHDTNLLLLKYLEVRMYISKSPYLFLAREKGERGEHINRRTLERWLATIGRELGIRLHPHRFRHGFAVERRKKRASLAFIQEALGHTNPVSTFRYTKYGPEFEEEAKGYL
jgi:integrase/recombinase XerD